MDQRGPASLHVLSHLWPRWSPQGYYAPNLSHWTNPSFPFTAATCLRGHYWDVEEDDTGNGGAPGVSRYSDRLALNVRGLPAFLGIFLFPMLFSAVSQANATPSTAIFPLIGLLAAVFILPEIYGFEHD